MLASGEAIGLAALGLKLFRVKPCDKRPAAAGWQSEATDDPDRLAELFGDEPTWNAGVATGEASGVVVIDLDLKPDKDGFASWEALRLRLGVAGETMAVRTGTGGRHLYYRLPSGFPGRIGNRTGVEPGVDVRGGGGYVVAPGSTHPNGDPYRVLNPGVPIAECPAGLLAFLARDREPAPAPRREVAPASAPAPRRERADTPADLILAFDPFARHCRDHAATISRDEWWALATNLALAEGGPELFHELSALDRARYHRGETDAILAEAKRADKPCTCEWIEAELGFRGYERWPFRGTVKAPVALKNADPDLLPVQARYVLATDINLYRDLLGGGDADRETINSRHAHRLTKLKAKPHDLLIRSPLTPKTDRADYRPDLPHLVFREREGGPLVLNRHVPGGVAAAAGDCGVLLDHFAHLLPDERERGHVLDVLAHMVRHPMAKVRHVVTLVGPQGVGKSFLARLIGEMVGAPNVFAVENEHLGVKWRRLWGDRQALVFEELMTSGRLELANALKTLITEGTITVEDKNVKLHSVRTPRVILGFTNHPDAVCLEETDRRWFVAETTREVRGSGYFDRLWGEGLAQAPAFKAFLLARDLGRFSPDAPPPETVAKAAMRRASRTPLARELQTLMDEGGVAPDVVTTARLASALVQRMVTVPGGFTPNKLARALREMGYVQYPANVRLADVSHPTKPWLSPAAAGRLQGATGAEVAAEYAAGLAPSHALRRAA